ncbi:hypothetical protein FPV16_18095 [Methylobacterium sp. W2]|uniref:hypothetical protein n=1 Tax=Methylobacterium sp. W2 TaxID=2598107 RepID=UPI001D0C41BB|nr:hypothetical protein [Methylobacterium sp. W2]MCC0808099.1 hypothetical protein [Methylobacterium sp. W2]
MLLATSKIGRQQLSTPRQRLVPFDFASSRSLIVDLTSEHLSFLQRMRRKGIVLSGRENNTERLSLLQLYVAGFVKPKPDRVFGTNTEWRITTRGRAAMSGSELRFTNTTARV